MKVAFILGNYIRQGYPPIGVLSLAANLRKIIPNCEIKVYDVFPEISQLLTEVYDVIAFSCMSIQYPDVCIYASHLREQYHGILIIGGVHITLTHVLPEWADYSIYGEGELTIAELCQFILGETTKPLRNIHGLVYRENGNVIKTPPRELIRNLDVIPFPAWDLLDMDYYLKPNNVYGTVVDRGLSLITSRGCIYKCVYCAASKIWNTIRFHSADYVARMVEYVVSAFGVHHIWFADDHFALNKSRLRNITSLLLEKQISISAGINCRIESYDDEMAQILKDLGVKAIAVGLETGSDRMLKSIKNGSRLSVAEEKIIVERMVADGFEVHGMFMMNLPGETIDDLKQTRDFIYSLPLSKCSVAIATPYYGTEWWEIALKQGIISDDPNDYQTLRSFNMKTMDSDRPLFKTDIPVVELKQIYDEVSAYCKQLFYFDWKNR